MALALSFTSANPCSGGNHWELTVNAGPFTRTLRVDRGRVADGIREEELETFFRVLLSLVLRQLTDQSGSNLRAKLATKTIDLGVTD